MDIAGPSSDSNYLSLLRNAQATLRAAKAKKGQTPSTRLSREELFENQKVFQDNASALPKFTQAINFISHNYPPSVAPLSTLTKIYINDLRLETSHRGSYVLLRTIGPSSKMGAITSVVEDQNGGCDFIQLYHMDESQGPQKILPEGQVLIVKEPFYSSDTLGEASLWVDHISDVVFLRPGDHRIPLSWQTLVDEAVTDWKEEGDKLFQSNEFHEAIECYTKGIEAAENLINTLKLSRLQAFLSIGYHDNALQDSDSVLKSDPTNEKALVDGAEALYSARKFQDCISRLQSNIYMCSPRNDKAVDILLRTSDRLHEEQTGKYNFERMIKLACSNQNGPAGLDCADFVGPVRLQDTINSGRGLFTTRGVEFGELLLCSKAFYVCYPETNRPITIDLTRNRIQKGAEFQLTTGVAQKLYNNPSTFKEFSKLFSGDYERVQENEVDGKLVVDTSLIHEIRELNSFGCPIPSSALHATELGNPKKFSGNGIWTMPSFINHACPGAASACRSFIGDMMIVRAARDIKEGEQITHAYCPADDYNTRQKTLLKIWGFECNCSLCAVESLEAAEVGNKRKAQLAKVLNLNSVGQYSASLSEKGIQLVRSIESTYSKPTSEQPRYEVAGAFLHLAQMTPETNMDEVLMALLGALDALGYELGEAQGKVIITRHGSISSVLPDIFHQCSRAYHVLTGDTTIVDSYRELAVCLYEVIFGERISFSEMYPD